MSVAAADRPTMAWAANEAARRIAARRGADPVGFVRDVLRADPWVQQEVILRAVAESHAQVAVKSCHASGKTFLSAQLVLWWVYAMDGIAITTAPTGTQVRTGLWAELHNAYNEAAYRLPGQLNTVELKARSGLYAIGRATNRGVRLQGFHGDRVLVVIDEAPGVESDIMGAVKGVRAGGDVRVLALGNPTVASGWFFEAFTVNADAWTTVTISAFDTPNLAGLAVADVLAMDDDALDDNVRPYLTTRRYVKEMWREGETSVDWQARVLGQFPTEGTDNLLPLGLLEAMQRRGPIAPGGHPSEEPCVAGVDVAGPGESETALCVRQGPNVVAIRAWSQPDPRGALVAALREYGVTEVNVDSIGQGYYLARHLADVGFTVHDVNVGVASSNAERYANLKAEAYWGLRVRLQDGDLAGLTDRATVAQMASLKYAQNSRGQIVIESKDDARKRGVKSPDRAECVMLAFWTPPRVPVVGPGDEFVGRSTWDVDGTGFGGFGGWPG